MPEPHRDADLRTELEVIVTAGAKLWESPRLIRQIPILRGLVEVMGPVAHRDAERARLVPKLIAEVLDAETSEGRISDDQLLGYRILFGISAEYRGMTATVRRDNAAVYLAPPRAPRRTEAGRRQSDIKGASMWARRKDEVLQPVADGILRWIAMPRSESALDAAESVETHLLRDLLVSFTYELSFYMKLRTKMDKMRSEYPDFEPDWTLDDWIQSFSFPNHQRHRGFSTDNLLFKYALVARLIRHLRRSERLSVDQHGAAKSITSLLLVGTLGAEDLADALGSPVNLSRLSFVATLQGSDEGRGLLQMWTRGLKEGSILPIWDLHFDCCLLAGLLGSERPHDLRIVSYCQEHDYFRRRDEAVSETNRQLKELMQLDEESDWEFSQFAVWGRGPGQLDVIDLALFRTIEAVGIP